MLDFHNRITEAGLTPNGYFAVLFHLLGVKQKTLIETNVEFRRLKKAGFLTENLSPTQKLLDTGLFDDLEVTVKEDKEDKALERKIGFFLSKFPLKLPTTPVRYPRGTVATSKKQFNEFFKHYNYSWDVIYKAAENYVASYIDKDCKYMRSAPNFIFKDGDSLLAIECEELVTHTEEEKAPWDIDI